MIMLLTILSSYFRSLGKYSIAKQPLDEHIVHLQEKTIETTKIASQIEII